MIHEPTSTARARRLCERRAKGVVMVAPVEVGEGGVANEKFEGRLNLSSHCGKPDSPRADQPVRGFCPCYDFSLAGTVLNTSD